MGLDSRLSFSWILLALIVGLSACADRDDDSAELEAAESAPAQETRPEPPARSAAREAGIETGAVVLMYHRFGNDRHPSTSVRMEQFEDHIEYLKEEDFNIWPLERVVEYLLEGRDFPDRTVAITIDDAYPTVYENAYPRFKELDWPYTVFVNTDGTDGGSRSYMSWEQMREMGENSRARFANHSASHDYLVARQPGESESEWRARVEADIQRAEDRLNEELGDFVPEEPLLLAWPFGEYDPALQEMIEDMGYVAFGQHSGPVGRHSDLLGLPRFAMAEAYADPDDFRLRVHTRPLPIREMRPNDPTAIDEQNPPRMELTFEEDSIDPGRINCFAGNREVEMEVESGPPPRLIVQAKGEMPEGRSRYNCTMPAAGGGFHWYSFQWLKGRR